MDGTFCKSNILAIYGYIQKGIDEVGVARGRDGHPEGKIAGESISHGWASYEEQLMGGGAQEASGKRDDRRNKYISHG